MSWLDPDFQDAFVKMSIAALCGLFIGLERGYRGKPAGVRTNLLICLGACLFMLVSERVAYDAKANGFPGPDPGRIAAQVVTGIGFLGAGAILRNQATITGLTTAASIWCVSAIGLAIGASMYRVGLFASLAIVVTLEMFSIIERRLRVRRFRYVRLEVAVKKETRIQDIRKVLRGLGIQFSNEETKMVLGETHYLTTLYYRGDLDKKIEDMLNDTPGVRDVTMQVQAVE